MSSDILNISLGTLIETSSLFDIQLDDRSEIKNLQNKYLVRTLQENTSKKLTNSDYFKYFTFGCMDFIVYEEDKEKKFYFIEINGTGMAGISNLPDYYFNIITNSISQNIEFIQDDDYPVILVPFSGTDCYKTSGSIKLVYERILYAQAIKNVLREEFGKSTILTFKNLLNQSGFTQDIPTVVMGYVKDIYDHIHAKDGRLYLFNRPVAASLHDQFCCDLLKKFQSQIDKDSFVPINGINKLAADKGVSYQLYNDLLSKKSYNYIDRQVIFNFAYNKEDLFKQVLDNIDAGKKIVIKPHSSELGRGIEFFVSKEPKYKIIRKIEESLKYTEQFYSPSGNVFPYTISEYVDGTTISNSTHPLKGHKYEVRIVVYRENNEIKSFPSLVKIASEKYDPKNISRYMLLNNVAASTGKKKSASTNFSLPACNYKTLKTLGFSKYHLEELCN
ncbi:MAG: hypothetical protein AB1782_04165, partial [Cyanobacteriota bacterium]